MRWLVLIFTLLFSLVTTSCTKTSSTANKANGQGFAGVIDDVNGRARCNYKELADRLYRVNCRAMVADTSGTESPATSIRAGVTLDWKEAFRREGGEITIDSFNVTTDGLSSETDITLNSGVPAKVQFDLVINNTVTQQTKTESDILILPLSARSFGRVAALLNYDVGSGLQNTNWAAVDTFVGQTHSPCEMGGNIYFTSENQIYSIKDGKIRLYAGSTNPENTNEYSHRLRLSFGRRSSLVIACGKDALYTIDSSGNSVLKISESGPVTKIGSTLSLDRRSSNFTMPTLYARAIAVQDENIYVADWTKVLKISQDGRVEQIARGGGAGYSVQNIAVKSNGTVFITDAVGSKIWMVEKRVFRSIGSINAMGIAVDPKKQQLFISTGNSILKLTANKEWYVVAGINGDSGFAGDGKGARTATFDGAYGISFASDGELIVADYLNNRIRKLNVTGRIHTIAGREQPVMQPDVQYDAMTAQFGRIKGLAIGPDDTIYAADNTLNQIHQIDSAGKISVKAGSGAVGYSGDGEDPKKAQLSGPSHVIVADNNVLYIADTGNERVRKISGNEISTYAYYLGMDPFRIDFGKSGEIYYAKSGSLGADITIGIANPAGAPQMLAMNLGTNGLAVTSENSLLYTANRMIYELNPQTGQSKSIAGTGIAGFSGDAGPALEAKFGLISDIAIDRGIIYIADTDNGRIRTLRKKGDVYYVDTLLGGASNKDCTGVIEEKVKRTAGDDEIRVSLSALCYAKPVAIAVRSFCRETDTDPHVTIAVAQSFGQSSNIIRVRRPCE